MNVLVLAAHGLNCRWLGPYGNEWVATPAADALACEAIVFDQHFADEPTAAGFRNALPTGVIQALRDASVTAAFLDDRKAGPADDRPWDRTYQTNPTAHPTPAAALRAALSSALDALAGRSPWLLWVETDRLVPEWDFELETYQQYAADTGRFEEGEEDEDPGEPIDQPTPGDFDPDDRRLWHRLHNSFAAAVTAFDAELGSLAEMLRARDLAQSTAWVLTAGYGWPLGEHGLVGPAGSRLHPELVHLPLLIRLPGNRQGMRRVPAFTQIADLGPTLLDLFGVPARAALPGASLVPLTAGTNTPWREDARSARGEERSLRTADWAYLPPTAAGPARLYRRPDDLWEVNDLAPRYPDECDRLAARLDGRPESKEPTP